MVFINGKEVIWERKIDMETFLTDNHFDPMMVVVEANKELVKRKDYKKFLVEDGMTLEVFAFIGGG